MKAVWCTPHAYRSTARLGAHHLSARLAARGWDVLFLSNPVSPFHVVNWRSHDTRLRLFQAMRGLEGERDGLRDRKSTRLNSSHRSLSRMPSSA